jgi:hypothetical protein
MSNWIETHPESPVRNTQSEGIGRIEASGGFVLINNLGRNIEMSRLENGFLRRQCLFDETLYPNDDEPSQFDLDMHAFLPTPDGKHLLALNHHGLVRVLDMASLRLVGAFLWYGDVERTVMIDGCLVGSSPNGYATEDAAADGIVIGEPWQSHVASGSRNRIRSTFILEDWGKVSAVEATGNGNELAIVSGRRLGLFSLMKNGALEIKKLLWETELPFSASWIKGSPERREILVAGEGEFASFSEEAGARLKRFPLKTDLAWGNGAVPLALAGDRLIGADRFGGIFSWTLQTASATGNVLLEPTASQPLGFAHMAVCGNHVLCGYNRGGYRVIHADL